MTRSNSFLLFPESIKQDLCSFLRPSRGETLIVIANAAMLHISFEACHPDLAERENFVG